MSPEEELKGYIEKYKDVHTYEYGLFGFICYNEPISIEFITHFFNHINWKILSRSPFLTMPVLSKFINNINIYELGKAPLTEDFIRHYFKKLNLKNIAMFQRLHEDFILEFKDSLDWELISEFQNLSFEFIQQNINYINIKALNKNKNYSTRDRVKLISICKSYKDLL